MHMTQLGDEELLKLLLENANIDINWTFYKCKWTLLLEVANIGDEKLLKIILENKHVSVNQADISDSSSM